MTTAHSLKQIYSRPALIATLAMGLCASPTPLLASDAGAFLGGMVTSRVLRNMSDRTQAEQDQAAAMQQNQAAASSAPSVEERIHTLDQLRANGSISKSEYDSRKKAIIDSI